MRLFKLFFFIFTCLITSSSFVGCSTFSDNSKSTNSGMLEPQAILKFNDVPIPVGLKPLPQASYSFESSGVRVGVLKYQGKASPDQIINFYKEQMAMYNWNLVNIVEYGHRLMNFERENESCIVTLEPKGNNVILTISLGPKSQAVAKRSKSPVK
ncbi:MAG: hypothetical protein PHC29_07775 [Candidatus Omnitrophica bacterium]|nr:hypothetical protein [Candidatus Omnitrophota bacterium]